MKKENGKYTNLFKKQLEHKYVKNYYRFTL